MKAVEAILLFLLLGGGVLVAGAYAVGGFLRRRALRRGRWEAVEHVVGGRVLIAAEKPGEPQLWLDTVSCSHPDFESRIEEARSEAETKVIAMNRPLRAR